MSQERDRYLESMRNYLAEHANNGRLEAAKRLAELLMLIPKIQVKLKMIKTEFISIVESRNIREGIHMRE